MADYAIDMNRQVLRATGIVEPAQVWKRDPETGKNKRTDEQLSQDGVPVWQVEGLYLAESFGRQETVPVSVFVPNPTRPVVEAYEPLPLTDVWVRAYVSNGQYRESWTASSIQSASSSSQPQPPAKPAEKPEQRG